MGTRSTIVGIVLALCCAAQAQFYEVIRPLAPSGYSFDLNDINNDGLVVGSITETATLRKRAILVNPLTGALRILGPAGVNSTASTITNSGVIGGTQYTTSSLYQAALFDPAGSQNNTLLGTLGGNFSAVEDIGVDGTIVGWAADAAGTYHAVVFDGTGAGHNTSIRSGSRAYGINSTGLIVGNTGFSGVSHAAILDRRGIAPPVDLGTIIDSANRSYGNAINDAGQVVGYAWTGAGGERAVLFDSTGGGNNVALGGFSPGAPKGIAYSINNHGQIVGYAETGRGGGETHATLFDPTGAGNNIDLSAFVPAYIGKPLSIAEKINNNGWILADDCILIPQAAAPRAKLSMAWRASVDCTTWTPDGMLAQQKSDSQENAAASTWAEAYNQISPVVVGASNSSGEIHAYSHDGYAVDITAKLAASAFEASGGPGNHYSGLYPGADAITNLVGTITVEPSDETPIGTPLVLRVQVSPDPTAGLSYISVSKDGIELARLDPSHTLADLNVLAADQLQIAVYSSVNLPPLETSGSLASSFGVTLSIVPEPASISLILLPLALLRRRRRQESGRVSQ